MESVTPAKNANRNYKDSLFRSYFKDPKRFLDVGNAIMGTNYGEDTPMVETTLEDALFMEQINDVSFLIDDRLVVFIEHQTSINYNMPLRMLIYAGRVYEKLVEGRNIYRSRRIDIPRAKFYVLYNGKAPFPAKKTVRLSEMYRAENKNFTINLELVVEIYNINSGHNPELLKKSRALYEYETLVELVRKHHVKPRQLGEAVKAAVAECKKRGILAEFLKLYGSEVENMIFTQWDTEEAKKVWYEEGVEEGMEKGVKMGVKKGVKMGVEEVLALIEKERANEIRKILAEKQHDKRWKT